MNRPCPPLPAADLEHVLAHTAPLWRDLAGARFFITGGTGFYGKWVLESIAAANDQLGAEVRATVLTRNAARFGAENPRLAARSEFHWLTGDAASFAFPAERFDYVFHFATASAAEVGAGGSASMMATLLGTERVLQFTRVSGARRMLFASSGAVYGRQPPELSQLREDYRGGRNVSDSASGYGEMKRLCEVMCVSAGIECVIARGFSFIGPYLPLTDKFAAGSFIRDALAGGPIRIRGDGLAIRSYLYGADLAIWLITLLVRGAPLSPYNLGSDHSVSLSELASMVAGAVRGVAVEISGASTRPMTDRYVPSVQKAREELGLDIGIRLTDALRRTLDWAGPFQADIASALAAIPECHGDLAN